MSGKWRPFFLGLNVLKVERGSTSELPKHTPYLALTGEIWGAFCEFYGEKFRQISIEHQFSCPSNVHQGDMSYFPVWSNINSTELGPSILYSLTTQVECEKSTTNNTSIINRREIKELQNLKTAARDFIFGVTHPCSNGKLVNCEYPWPATILQTAHRQSACHTEPTTPTQTHLFSSTYQFNTFMGHTTKPGMNQESSCNKLLISSGSLILGLSRRLSSLEMDFLKSDFVHYEGEYVQKASYDLFLI